MDFVNKIRDSLAGATESLPLGDLAKAAGAASALYGAYKIYRFMRPAYLTFTCDGKGRAVVISGCDTGFGNSLASLLDQNGFRVYALCLTDSGVKQMTGVLSKRSAAVKCDITRQEDIDSFAARLASERERIWALVNNAGIGRTNYIEAMHVDDYRKVMEVNFIGHVAMTQALLPLVVRGGRIVNMASIAGRIGLPVMASYCASKFAMEAYSDVLRHEMRVFGIKVVTMEPTFHSTPLVKDSHIKLRQLFDAASPAFHERYGKEFVDDVCKRSEENDLFDSSLDPEGVVKAYFHAVGAKEPFTRYKVGTGAALITFVGMLPDSIIGKFIQLRQAKDAVLPIAARQ